MTEEKVIFVNKNGKPTGETGEKLTSHTDTTRLHLAFSCYVFNEAGQFLITKRAASKKVWPDVWTNSVCGHPAPGESMTAAISRRLNYELGMKAEAFQVLASDYIYKTPPFKGIVEHEFCPIYIARATTAVRPNPVEVEAYRWISWEAYVNEIEADKGNYYSWWCKDQLKLIKIHPLVASYGRPATSAPRT